MSNSGSLEPLVCFGIKELGVGYQLQNVMFFIGVLNFISHVYKYNLNHYILIFCHFVLTNRFFFQNVLYAWMNVRTQYYINVDIWPAVLAAVKGFKYVLFVELL